MMCCECVFTKTPHALHYLSDEINLVCHVGRSIAHTRDSMNKESISLHIYVSLLSIFCMCRVGECCLPFFIWRNCHFLFVACYIAIFTRTLYYTCWLCRTINKLTCDGISHLYALYYNMYMNNTIILYMHTTKQRIKYKMIHRYMYTKWLYMVNMTKTAKLFVHQNQLNIENSFNHRECVLRELPRVQPPPQQPFLPLTISLPLSTYTHQYICTIEYWVSISLWNRFVSARTWAAGAPVKYMVEYIQSFSRTKLCLQWSNLRIYI